MPNYTHDLRRVLSAEVSGALGLLVDKTPRIDVDTTADVGGSGETAVVGFQLKDQAGLNIASAMIVGFGVYDDTNGVTPGASATLNTATAGTILSGAASNELVVLTSATGKFTCTLTKPIPSPPGDETVYLMGRPAPRGGPSVDATDRESVEFTDA